MALGFLNATPTGFRFGEYVDGVFQGALITGTGLIYDINGVPIGGTISAMNFAGALLQTSGLQTDLGRIVFPKGTLVTSLTTKGFDWFASASTTSGSLVVDVTILLTRFDKLSVFALPRPLDETSTIASITTGNQDDRINATSDDTLISDIFSNAGKDRINVSGYATTINAGADKDVVTVDTLIATVLGGTGDDILNVTAISANVLGGADDDKISLTILPAETIEGHQINGFAFVDGGTGHDLIEITATEDHEAEVQGGKGNDTITGSDAGSESFYGNAGHDVIHLAGVGLAELDIGTGGAGNDLITSAGTEGTAILLGGLGNDTLTGGTGHNFLWGGDGNDVLTGNGGLDTYMLDRGFDVAIASADLDAFVFADTDTPTNATIIGFDVTEDWLLIDTDADLDAEDSYDLFLSRATQVGDDVLYDDGAGNTLLLQDVLLGNITGASIVGDNYTGPPPFNDSI